MGAAPIIVVIAVVVVVAVVLILAVRRRSGHNVRSEGSDAVEGDPATVRDEERGQAAVAPPPRRPSADERSEDQMVTPRAEPDPIPPPKPKASEAELREQVASQLEDAKRMLGELKKADIREEMVDIMEEGLKEVRGLADRKQWSGARDKGRALHAQLSLMLQSARRGKAS